MKGFGGAAFAALPAACLAAPMAIVAAMPGALYLAGFDHLALGLGLLAGAVLAGVWIGPRVRANGAETIAGAINNRFGNAASRLAGLIIALAALPMLTAEFTVIGMLAEGYEGAPSRLVLLGAFALSGLAAVLLGDRHWRALCALTFSALAISVLVLLISLAGMHDGSPLALFAYGPAVQSIAAREEALLLSGQVNFETFGAHTATFLKLTALDFTALIVTLSLGTAALPSLVGSLTNERPSAITRLTGAWTSFWLMLVLVSMPAVAVYAKLGVYDALEQRPSLNSLPTWIEAPSRAGLAHVHGTSLALLEHAADAAQAGATETDAISQHLALSSLRLSARWDALDPTIHSAILAAARSLPPDASRAQVWTAYVSQVLPAAATAEGNEAGTLTQSALAFEPLGFLLALPSLAGLPQGAGAAILLSFALAAQIVIVALLRSVLALWAGAQDSRTAVNRWPAVAVTAIVAGVAAGVAALGPDDPIALSVSGLALCAAGLFPVCAIGLAWRRVSRAAAVAAIVTGAAVSLYYDVGTQVFPASFYATWPALSNAGETAVEEFNSLQEAYDEAEGSDAKAAARIALDDWARGSETRPGLANWAGVDGASSAAFAVPAGLIILLLVTLIAPARAPRRDQP